MTSVHGIPPNTLNIYVKDSNLNSFSFDTFQLTEKCAFPPHWKTDFIMASVIKRYCVGIIRSCR